MLLVLSDGAKYLLSIKPSEIACERDEKAISTFYATIYHARPEPGPSTW